MPRIPTHTRIGAQSLLVFISTYTILYAINDQWFDKGRVLFIIYGTWAIIMGAYIVILFFIGIYNMIRDRF